MDFLMNLGEGSQFAIQLAIVLICLFYGAKKGGIALGMLGGVGLIVLVFGFGIEPGKPAIDVMLTILAVVVTSATLQASGGGRYDARPLAGESAGAAAAAVSVCARALPAGAACQNGDDRHRYRRAGRRCAANL